MAAKEKPEFKTSLQSLKDLAETDTKIKKIGEATSRYIALLDQYSTTIENAVGMYEKYNKAFETHIQLGGKASDFNLAEITQLQSLLLIKQQYTRQSMLEGASYKDATEAVNKKMLAEKLATEETLKSVQNLEDAQKKIAALNEAQEKEKKEKGELKNAISGLTNKLQIFTNPLVAIASFFAKGVLETLAESWESLQTISSVQLGAGIGRGGGLGDLMHYSAASSNAYFNLNYDQGQSRAAIENLIRNNALFSNRSGATNVQGKLGYAGAFTEVATATRAYGLTMSESSKLMQDAYRYNTGDFKGILKDLAGVSSATNMNMSETVNYFNRLNEITGKYATQQQFATQAVFAFSDSLQKGRISVENLNFSMQNEGLGKTIGMAQIAAMSPEGVKALRDAKIDPNADPIVQATQMRKLEESAEGQKHLAEITRQMIINIGAQTGYGTEEVLTLIQKRFFGDLLPGVVQTLFSNIPTGELGKFMAGEMVGFDVKQKYTSETPEQYNKRLIEMDLIAKARRAEEHPEVALISGIGEILKNTVENGAFKIRDADSPFIKQTKGAMNMAQLPGTSEMVRGLAETIAGKLSVWG